MSEENIKPHKDELSSLAQEVYEEWDQSDEEYGDPELGMGGICDEIADRMSNYLQEQGFETFTNYNEYDSHTSTYAYDPGSKTLLKIDIPPQVYEEGTGYNWKKRPDVRMTAQDVTVDDMSELYDEFIDEDGELRDL